MICNTPKELLAEIRKYMNINHISMKELASNMNKSQQSVSQYFTNSNPNCQTILDICNGMNVKLDINFIKIKGDTE